MKHLPARRADLIINTCDGELVVLDPIANRAMTLTPVAASVLASCDGSTTDGALLHQFGDDAVGQALDSLADAGLLAGRTVTRRAVLAGGAVGAGAIVAMVAMPTAQAAASAVGGGDTGGEPVNRVTIGHSTPPTVNADNPDYDSNTSNYALTASLIIPPNATVESFAFYASGFHDSLASSSVQFFLVDASTKKISYISPSAPVTFNQANSVTLPAGVTSGGNGAYFGIHASARGVVPYANGSPVSTQQYEGTFSVGTVATAGYTYSRDYSQAVTYRV